MVTAKAAVSTAAAGAVATLLLDYTLGVSKDVKAIREETDFLNRFTQYVQRQGDQVNLYHVLDQADPYAEALWFEGRSWNYSAFKAEVNVLALGFQQLGVVHRDFVAVFMTNSPEMVFAVFALAKLGDVPALLNSTLREDTLLHCVRLPAAKLIVSTPDLAPFAATAAASFDGTIRTYSLSLGSFQVSSSTHAPAEVRDFPIPDRAKAATVTPARTSPTDPGVLIYTSGTTGKPKACSIKNSRVCVTCLPNPADYSNLKKYFPLRAYSCMPLFHGTTFLAGMSYCVGNSGCFCSARRFSARNFWKDVAASRATRIVYVGELCRYLLAAPESEYDRKDHCIVAMGNGLQKDVWLAFKKRFGVPEIREFYRSTEGLAKYDNQQFGDSRGVGKVGFVGVLKRSLEKDQFLVKFDYDTEMPYRDPKTGFCVLAGFNEPGEAIARIKHIDVYPEYLGNKLANEAKTMRDVFIKGDMSQRSGDLLMQERSGWVHFVDRVGDTFRWKGDNVSAGEIRGFISELPHVQDVVVVGKQLKGYDGQAGVAAISLDSSLPDVETQFIQRLYGNLKKKGVPDYALPRLVALTNELVAVGATFKHAKQVVKGLVCGNPTRRQPKED
ncbi:hypothetical protein LTR10_016749 [Elasticomyces elasticus]|uniref:AMP-dependent synthetase/ligase domain-containing protein n=1 Tax=Exophiala sideris TaxID=1016849 RepID=A0ABR0JN78_9EURO|nr:hypothetical protein LTR10_016749 [Elasticomyces elasticus]KAK5037753.1 hypothetical protein LTS07_001220 [Exophiala sideris]KAK5043735.1 hypothetical protein LTR13_000089 [Exophiala sideris]KAK5067234.1 hypothetical protein LTR69_001221 [Exophiala sideris]KAK5182567.1 hypothetical protein LTR44_004958 [Eurotiomycetes sp. CCFEE 6388]